MKRLIMAIGGTVIAGLLIATPLVVKTNVVSSPTLTVSVEFESNDAYAGKSRRSSSRRSSSSSRSRNKSKCCTSNFKKKKSGGSSISKQKANKNRSATKPFGTTATKKKTKAPTKSLSKSTTRKPLSRQVRKTRTKTQRTSITSPKARSSRLSAQTTRSSRLRTTSRSDMRSMRSSRGYWRSERQYRSNYYWRSRNMYGWGYGYYPGQTYHRGWGVYGYGYTRGGLNIVDMMIISAMFNRTQTSGGTTVINNYAETEGFNPEDVVAVPQGTQIFGTSPNQYLSIPDGQGGSEDTPIPAGSTFTQINGGMMIQTPDGQAVLIPNGSDAYKADAGYQVPISAQQEQEYAPLEEETSWYCLWLC